MVVPTGHPITEGTMIALQADWTYIYLGASIGGVTVPDYNFVAIIPFFTNYQVSFNGQEFDWDYAFMQYSGPPEKFFLGTMGSNGLIYHNSLFFGTAFGWAGIPPAMHYHKISGVGIARVPRVQSSGWHDRSLPAFVIKDPLIIGYNPSIWVGTECLVAWATIDDATKEVYDELMTAKDYIGVEVVSLPTSYWYLEHFWPILDQGYVEGLSEVHRGTTFYGTLFVWAWSTRKFHLFDESRYRYFDPVIKPGGKVLAAGILWVGSVGVNATAERYYYPQPGDPDYFRFCLYNPAPFNAIRWFDVQAFLVGYYYERNGSHIFEVSYGAVLPPCYTVDYVGQEVLCQVYLATNLPSGSVLVHQAVLATPTRVQFHPQSYSNLLTVINDWLYDLLNTDRFWLISDVNEPIVVTPEDSRDETQSSFTACHLKTWRPVRVVRVEDREDGRWFLCSYSSLSLTGYMARYLRSDGHLSFRGCVTAGYQWVPLLDIRSSRFGLRWLVPWHTGVVPSWCSMDPYEAWVINDPIAVDWNWYGGEIPRYITTYPPDYTNLPDDRIIDVERFHRFYYTDIFVLWNGRTLIGSKIVREGPYYVLEITNGYSVYPYSPRFVGSWVDPTPDYYEYDPYNIIPEIKRKIERRFRYEVAHSNYLSDAHIRIQTSVPREFISCFLSKPYTFWDTRSGLPLADWRHVIPTNILPYGYLVIPPSIDFQCPKEFASFKIPQESSIPIVIGLTRIDFATRIAINPIVPLIAEPGATYTFVRPFNWQSYTSSILSLLDDLVPAFVVHKEVLLGSIVRVPSETIKDYELRASGVPFLAVGSNDFVISVAAAEPSHVAPAPFIRGGQKVKGLGSLYQWAQQEGLTVPAWLERYIFRNGVDGDHFVCGTLPIRIVYASYWPLEQEREILLIHLWRYTGTNLIKPIFSSESIYGIFNEDFRFGTILWHPPLYDHIYDLGSYRSHRARLLFPHRGWHETLPAGKIRRIPDPMIAIAVYGTSTYLDREVVLVRQIVTLGNNVVQLYPRKAVFGFGRIVPYFTQDGGKCPLWLGEPIIGVDGVPYDDGRIVVHVYSVRGVYSFLLTPFGVENWSFGPVPRWFWKLLTGE